ncbi:MAG: glycoside hydrolase family 27 protein, partial [Clostridia bacterium]|nr:glycoside hydrolase family 27 protein [Clostridia bacterium]
DAMVESGMLDAGYEYLVIDDCWSEKKRDENGRLVADPNKFPNGMKAVADYVHSKGLKFGMYSCAGSFTCAGFPGSFDYEFIDAETFASWGVDYLKYDYCFRPINQQGPLLYKKMGLALANCGRDICFSACSWGADKTNEWIKETGAHLWRSTGDITDSWQSVKDLIYKQDEYLTTNGQGCFNDMDMLIVGMRGKGNVAISGCTDEEYRTHFSAWAFLGSPLMAGCDVRNMDDVTKSILLDKEIIAINQDAAYRQPFTCGNHWWINEVKVWAKFLEGGDIAVGIFNLSDHPADPFIPLDALGLSRVSGKAVSVRDLWKKEELGVFADVFRTECIPAHECRMYRLKVVNAK